MDRVLTLIGAGFTLTFPLGDGAPTVQGGGAIFEEIQRSNREPLTEWQGSDLLKLSIPLMLDGFATDRDVQPDLNALLGLVMTGDEEPPSFIANGPIPFAGERFVMEQPEWGAGVRNAAGVLVRQPLTAKLLQYVEPDSIVISKTGAGGGAAAAKKKKRKKKVTAKKGDTLAKIAVRVFGDRSRAKEIAKLNDLRDPRKKLKPGTVIRLPAPAPKKKKK